MKCFLVAIVIFVNFAFADLSLTVCPTLQLTGDIVTKFENLVVVASSARDIIGHKVDLICIEGPEITSALKLSTKLGTNVFSIIGEQECLKILRSVYKNSRGINNYAMNIELNNTTGKFQVLSFSVSNQLCTYEGKLSEYSKTIVRD